MKPAENLDAQHAKQADAPTEVDAVLPQMEPVFSRPAEQRLKIMAHQGYQGEYPPNSFQAIEAAFGVADAVEFDIYAIPRSPGSNEIEIVCCHPEGYFLFVDSAGMKNTDNLPLSYDEAKEITVRGMPLIPRLADVIDVYEKRSLELGKRTELQIELKGPGTPTAVVEPLKEMIAAGKIGYEDFLLTGLCYPGDRSRVEDPLALDPNLRMVLVVRGGDFSQDGFSGWQEVFEYAREQGVSCITGQRKGTTAEDIRRIHEEGFEAGCFHSRTSDELEAALALGADYVAADFYRGPSYADYQGVRLHGSPLFSEITETGFYVLRDWIWEQGWACEALRRDPAQVESLQRTDLTSLIPDSRSEQAAFRHSFASHEVLLQLCEAGERSSTVLDYSSVSLNQSYLGAIDKALGIDSCAAFLSEGAMTATFARLTDAVLLQKQLPELPGSVRFSFEEIVALSEGHAVSALRAQQVELEPEQVAVLEEVGRECLTRAGRVVGMLAFTALMPRHMPGDSFAVAIESPLTQASFWARKAAAEQVDAQLLRSGKTGEATFG